MNNLLPPSAGDPQDRQTQAPPSRLLPPAACPRSLRWTRAALLAALPALAMLLSSCSAGMLAWSLEAFSPPKTVKAEYQPPPGRTFLVFVDDMLQPVDYEPIKSELAGQINDLLMEKKVAGAVIPYRNITDLAARRPDFNALSVGEIGRELKADIVLYVRVDKFSLRDESGGPLWHGQLQVTIRMVDVENGWNNRSEARLWPKDKPDGQLIPLAETPASTESSPNHGREITRALSKNVAHAIVSLFHEHKEAASTAYD